MSRHSGHLNLRRRRCEMKRIRRAARLLVVTLREIFDENSYARFLQRRGVGSSREAYAEFVKQEAKRQERRARCC